MQSNLFSLYDPNQNRKCHIAVLCEFSKAQLGASHLLVSITFSKKGAPHQNFARTSCVLHAGHSLFSKQDICCAPSKTFLALQAGHSLCSKQDIPCVPGNISLMFHIILSSHHRIIISSQHHIFISSYQQTKKCKSVLVQKSRKKSFVPLLPLHHGS